MNAKKARRLHRKITHNVLESAGMDDSSYESSNDSKEEDEMK
jgi:hypothetical protein